MPGHRYLKGSGPHFLSQAGKRYLPVRFVIAFVKNHGDCFLSSPRVGLFSSICHRGDIVLVGAKAVGQLAVLQHHNAVGDGLHELVVMAGEQDVAFEQLQVVVESLDAFQVQMICRSVQNKTVGVFSTACGLSYNASSLLPKAR